MSYDFRKDTFQRPTPTGFVGLGVSLSGAATRLGLSGHAGKFCRDVESMTLPDPYYQDEARGEVFEFGSPRVDSLGIREGTRTAIE